MFDASTPKRQEDAVEDHGDGFGVQVDNVDTEKKQFLNKEISSIRSKKDKY
jgi:hypothetical protein